MADSVVTCFMENLGRLVSTQEGNSDNWVREVTDQVKKLEEELNFIDGFLRAFEKKRNENDEVEDVVDQITEAVVGAEDVLENYMAAKLFKHSKWNLMVKAGRDPSGLIKVLQDVTKKIRNTNSLINHIYGNPNKYGIVTATDDDGQEQYSHRERRRNIGYNDNDNDTTSSSLKLLQEEEEHDDDDDDDDVVGFVHDTSTLVKQLISTTHRFIISITGMSGLGKTTLARKIYNDDRVKNHFDCRAWVYVSRDFKTNKECLLLGIIRCLMPISYEETSSSSSSTANYQRLKEKLQNYLNSKKCLIVLDNVWTADVIDEVRELALPNNSPGSRILITTRLADDVQAKRRPSSSTIASPTSNNNIFVYRLPLLDKNESWQLLCKKVFGEKECPPQLETIGRQVAESCKGLPISILVLGGLLYYVEESTHVSWSKLTGSISTVSLNISDEKTRCLDILTLSYNHLPRHLKSCFLYLGVFPTEFVISARKLIDLWLAEGLIPTTTSTSTTAVENVAEEYLEELIDRSLIQVTSRRTDGGVKTCRIHEIVQDLSVFESSREEFVEVHSKANPSSMIDYVRRLSIQGTIAESISSYSSDPSCARSLFVFGERDSFDSKRWRWIYKNMKLIRVLCLEKVNLNSIPNYIEKLLFLRYLKIWSGTENVVEIPAAICNLQFLETIDVKGRVKDCLPKQLLSMKRLRHLNFSGGMSLFPDSSSTDTSSPSNLQVLSYLLVGTFSDIINLLIKFPRLRKLHLRCTNNDNDKKGSDDEVAKELGSPQISELQSLKVVGFRKSVPSSILLPSTLVKITFKTSCLDSTQFGILGKLPKLRFLKLKGNEFSTFTLSSNADEFPNLRVFQMIDLKIKTWELKSNAMPELRRLVIIDCHELANLPKGLSSLKALQIVQVSPVSESFTDVLEELEFRDSLSEVY